MVHGIMIYKNNSIAFIPTIHWNIKQNDRALQYLSYKQFNCILF